MEGAGNRGKPQTGDRRFSQKTAGNRRLGSVTLGPSPLARPWTPHMFLVAQCRASDCLPLQGTKCPLEKGTGELLRSWVPSKKFIFPLFYCILRPGEPLISSFISCPLCSLTMWMPYPLQGTKYLGGRFGYFLLFPARGRGRGSPGRPGELGFFSLKMPRGGGGDPRGGG